MSEPKINLAELASQVEEVVFQTHLRRSRNVAAGRLRRVKRTSPTHAGTQLARVQRLDSIVTLGTITRTLDALPERERRILTLGAQGTSRPRIAAELDLTPERVGQLEDQAVKRIRKMTTGTPPAFYYVERFGPLH